METTREYLIKEIGGQELAQKILENSSEINEREEKIIEEFKDARGEKGIRINENYESLNANRIEDKEINEEINEVNKLGNKTTQMLNDLYKKMSNKKNILSSFLDRKRKDLAESLKNNPNYINEKLNDFDNITKNISMSAYGATYMKYNIIDPLIMLISDNSNSNQGNLRNSLMTFNDKLNRIIRDAKNDGIHYNNGIINLIPEGSEGGKKKSKKNNKKNKKICGGGDEAIYGLTCTLVGCCFLTGPGGCVACALIMAFFVYITSEGGVEDVKNVSIAIYRNIKKGVSDIINTNTKGSKGGTKKRKRNSRVKINTRRKRKFLKLNRKISKNMRIK